MVDARASTDRRARVHQRPLMPAARSSPASQADQVPPAHEGSAKMGIPGSTHVLGRDRNAHPWCYTCSVIATSLTRCCRTPSVWLGAGLAILALACSDHPTAPSPAPGAGLDVQIDVVDYSSRSPVSSVAIVTEAGTR